MWTERERVIDNWEEAMLYIESQDCFHDYRLGNIEISENLIKVMIEEDTGSKNNEKAHIWDFSFGKISEVKCVMDCVITPYVDEVSIENHNVTIALNSGCISFKAGSLSIGIPKISSIL